MRKFFYLILILSVAVTAACKKDKNPGNNPTPTDTAATKLQIAQDSVYLYAKEIYYWNSFLPDYKTFNPRQYTSGSTDLDKLTAEIDAYTQLSKNPQNGNRPYEYDDFNPGSSKYSFIDDGDVNNELNATKGDYGFNYFYNTASDIRISLIYAGSPAALAGLTRGDQIVAINGSTSINITNLNDPANDAGYKFVSSALNGTSTVTLQLKKTNGSTVNVTLNAKTYTLNPLIYANTYKVGTAGKVAGYMVFNAFTSPDVAKPKLDSVFNVFASAGVTDLVIDLRYNGGGDVRTSTYLSNLIAPSSASGSVMNTTYWTANLQNDAYPYLKKNLGDFGPGYFKPTNANQIEKFAKAGSVNVSRVFFIVTGNTASASELTINNLRPKMDVQLIGQTTYGKPVGFLSNLIVKGHYFYTPEFEIKNSANEGGYYLGMEPGGVTPNGGIYSGKLDDDDLTKSFGDKTEGLLNDALTYIQTNAYPQSGSTQVIQSLSATQKLSSVQRNTLAVKTNSHKLHAMYITLKGKK
ncbi:S41 family peptidase [Mucilaginibacter aquaedulcis]|uniref:S41 family peptidase n=1 Tax=Mucilaginibacter aquaedulcis TaxID=1187081 RepID=UPI0025B51F9A|nr:S41 family peptidase [Mucilaginibacter aquaedulcis]MDN3547387.1 S41 family peptidase [Mucilaginibacter aquaedulcis]